VKLSVFGVADQKIALKHLASLAEKSTVHPLVRETAALEIAECADRDDLCEIESIFNAVKYGGHSKPLRNGLKYVADPRWADHFTAPSRILEQLSRGVNMGDCDDQAMLLMALLGAIGFKTGARAWGRKKGSYSHVYAVVAYPKRIGRNPSVLGLDTTVKESHVGWEPPDGFTLTAWIE